MSFDIVPFEANLIQAAGYLLARRHRGDRARCPDLPARFEDPAVAGAAVEAIWKRPHAEGVAALDNGRLQAYLIGDLQIDALWGRSGWVRLPGCAVAPDTGPEIVRDLYTTLGQRWVRLGCFTHAAVVPAADAALVDVWFRLSFGLEQECALLDLEQYPQTGRPPQGVEIRRAGPADRQTIVDLSDIIWRHQTHAPVWGIHLPEQEAEDCADWAALVDDPTATVWLALEQGQAIGFQCFFPAEEAADNLLIPPQCVELSVAGTRAASRGGGIGLALTRHSLTHARASGYRHCLTDWRSTNLLSSRFWPRQGFQPAAYRLVRRVDPRIAWANGWDV